MPQVAMENLEICLGMTGVPPLSSWNTFKNEIYTLGENPNKTVCSMWNTAVKRAARILVFETGEVRLCGCGRAARKGGRQCNTCIARYMRAYRAREKKKREAMLQAMADLTGANQATRREFESRFDTRHVIVVSQPLDPFDDFSGLVTGFLPNGVVVVVNPDGERFELPIGRLLPDKLRVAV